MSVFMGQHQPGGLNVADDVAGAVDRLLPEETPDLSDPAELTEGFELEVLAAMADMALRSKRRQADFDAAMRRAGLETGLLGRQAALNRLHDHGFIDKLVPLSDGGVLLSVTALGLDRLGGARRH